MRPYTLDDIVSPYRSYPAAVQQAILLAHTHPAFLVLTKSSRKVLTALLTRASQFNGLSAIRARIDRLADEAGVSDKTVQRALATLASLGWLQVPERARSEFGLYCSRAYRFTEALCDLVALPRPGVDREDRASRTEMSDGAVYVDLSFKKDLREISVKKRQENPDANPITLPPTLQELVKLGVKDTGVCRLRALARQAGHRLEDIVLVAKSFLLKGGITGGRAYRYVLALISRGSDYAARALQLTRLEEAQQQRVQEVNLEQQCRGKTFRGRNGLIVRFLDSGGIVAERDRRDLGAVVGQDRARVFAMVARGDLVELQR